ncbi:MAG: FxsA family protein [Thermoguttaceae bacterium]|nr:FxsA family protein [Thermoguttaceae bacterium]
MVIRYFWIISLLEIAAVVLLGVEFGFGRIVAALILLFLVGLILFRLSPSLTTRRDGTSLPPDERLLFKLGTILIMAPGFLTTLAGIPLLFRPGRALYRRFLEKKLVPNLPDPVRLFVSFFGLGGSAPQDAETGSNRTWNPYGPTETSQDEVVEDDDPDTADAYNGDISSGNSTPDDDDIIDVDYTVQ